MRQLGLDLGGTDIKLALLEDDRLVATDTTPTRSEIAGPPAVLERLVALGRSVGSADSVGVSVPGLVDAAGCGLLFPNLYGDWLGQPITSPLTAGFGQPVALLNDGHAFALAEARVGAARGSRDVICIVCGTGVGGGLVLSGHLHLGIGERAGEVGHQTVEPDGEPCGCGNHGCLETIAGARAIARAGRYVGIAIANLTIFLTPERVVIGGGVAEAGELLLDPIREEVRRRAGKVAPLDEIGIVRAELGPYAGAIGAALYGAERRS